MIFGALSSGLAARCMHAGALAHKRGRDGVGSHLLHLLDAPCQYPKLASCPSRSCSFLLDSPSDCLNGLFDSFALIGTTK